MQLGRIENMFSTSMYNYMEYIRCSKIGCGLDLNGDFKVRVYIIRESWFFERRSSPYVQLVIYRILRVIDILSYTDYCRFSEMGVRS